MTKTKQVRMDADLFEKVKEVTSTMRPKVLLQHFVEAAVEAYLKEVGFDESDIADRKKDR